MAKRNRKSVAENNWIHLENNIKIYALRSIWVIHWLSLQKIHTWRYRRAFSTNPHIAILVQTIEGVRLYIDDTQTAKLTHWYQWQKTLIFDWIFHIRRQENVLHSQPLR